VKLRLGIWTLVAAAVVLATRALVYALAPQSLVLAELADNRVVGPHLALPLLAILGAAAVLGAGALAVAVASVRVRLELEGRRLVSAPRLRPARLAVRAIALFLATSFAFAMLESYIHWREGLGWHGLHCLVGPVHRDAIPLLAALSLLAVAVHGAIELLLAWARRLFAQLTARLFAIEGAGAPAPSSSRFSTGRRTPATNGARGPPQAVVPAL
jgi:hypothetical protein